MRFNTRPIIMIFSGNGEDILEIIEKTKTTPDLLITNEREKNDSFNKELLGVTNFISLPKNPTEKDYAWVLEMYENPIVTFHQWYEEIPKSIIESYTCYRSHRKLIDFYPELKDGSVKGEHEWIGSVIQEVTLRPYQGKIVYSCRSNSKLDKYPPTLQRTSVEAWTEFLKNDKLMNLIETGNKKWTTIRWVLGEKEREHYNIAC